MRLGRPCEADGIDHEEQVENRFVFLLQSMLTAVFGLRELGFIEIRQCLALGVQS